MRMMMKVKMDTEAGSRAIADGSLPELPQETLGQLKPEAATVASRSRRGAVFSGRQQHVRPTGRSLKARVSPADAYLTAVLAFASWRLSASRSSSARWRSRAPCSRSRAAAWRSSSASARCSTPCSRCRTARLRAPAARNTISAPVTSARGPRARRPRHALPSRRCGRRRPDLARAPRYHGRLRARRAWWRVHARVGGVLGWGQSKTPLIVRALWLDEHAPGRHRAQLPRAVHRAARAGSGGARAARPRGGAVDAAHAPRGLPHAEHLATPTEDLAGDDALARLLRELAVRAAGSGDASPATFEIERLQLSLARADREIAAARTAGLGAVAGLAARRTAIHAQLDAALQRAMDEELTRSWARVRRAGRSERRTRRSTAAASARRGGPRGPGRCPHTVVLLHQRHHVLSHARPQDSVVLGHNGRLT